MSHTFTKKGLRGFTLIELLVVIAIIGLLSTVIAAPITQARKKGRDGKKVADLHQIQGALQQYADDHVGNYPSSISSLATGAVYLATLPPFASSTAPAKDKYMYTAYVTDTSSTTVGFHLGVKLEATGLALGDDRDCVGAGPIAGNDAYCIDINADPAQKISGFPGNYAGATWGTTPTTFASDELVNGAAKTTQFPIGVINAYDFAGGSDTADGSVTKCTAAYYTANTVITAGASSCIYDITN